MAVARLDTAASGNTDDQSYTVSAGSNRCLIVCITDEDDLANLDDITVTWGGKSMAEINRTLCSAGTLSHDVTMFMLLESDISTASGSTIAITNQGTKFTWHAISYTGVDQTGGATTVPQTNTDFNNTSTPNPLTGADISGSEGSVIVAIAGSGSATTGTWTSGTNQLTEQTDQQASSSHTGSMADRLLASAENADCECTWATTNRSSIATVELAAAAAEGTAPLVLYTSPGLSVTNP